MKVATFTVRIPTATALSPFACAVMTKGLADILHNACCRDVAGPFKVLTVTFEGIEDESSEKQENTDD